MSAKYVPPANFAPIERRLYRSAAPHPVSFSFLKLLGIQTIIWLALEDPSDELLDFVDNNELRLEHLGLLTPGSKPWDPLSDANIEEALEHIVDVELHPVLICCSMGRHRTGAVVGCLRKLQGWSFASLVDEYQRFTGLSSERTNVELAIENFSLEHILQYLQHRQNEGLTIPFWLGHRMSQQKGK